MNLCLCTLASLLPLLAHFLGPPPRFFSADRDSPISRVATKSSSLSFFSLDRLHSLVLPERLPDLVVLNLHGRRQVWSVEELLSDPVDLLDTLLVAFLDARLHVELLGHPDPGGLAAAADQGDGLPLPVLLGPDVQDLVPHQTVVGETVQAEQVALFSGEVRLIRAPAAEARGVLDAVPHEVW
eukprot:CAMPEP_0197884590 /NCGR_PEP_ID=MMETSP1439-20131203/10981_1 /TAXON_ID=66791 /ORGANISM="Gonyaulax spinifera, Strain CCMP409" /LENGTH=182 /DNA_ID=CAMNT_0043504327 /DNA_START=413 /DNA_END=958 /DNA_ORIENTATION=+